MIKETTQVQRLNYLVEEFKTDSGEYRDFGLLLTRKVKGVSFGL